MLPFCSGFCTQQWVKAECFFETWYIAITNVCWPYLCNCISQVRAEKKTFALSFFCCYFTEISGSSATIWLKFHAMTASCWAFSCVLSWFFAQIAVPGVSTCILCTGIEVNTFDYAENKSEKWCLHKVIKLAAASRTADCRNIERLHTNFIQLLCKRWHIVDPCWADGEKDLILTEEAPSLIIFGQLVPGAVFFEG
jgi:hypothetical protein